LATFSNKIIALNWIQGVNSTNVLYSSTATGTFLQTPGATANNNDSKIFFRNSGGIAKQTFDTQSGAATFVGQINANSGISFPNQSAGSGTVSSSTLDAYEEGTSTIYFRATGQSPTPTATAYYTRIGNIVYYCFEGTINATANSNAYFDGLPFLPASGYPRSAFYVGWNSATHNSNGGTVYTSGTYAGTGFFWQRNAFALASYWYTGTQYLTVSGSYQV
jgi:hypothetical protein